MIRSLLKLCTLSLTLLVCTILPGASWSEPRGSNNDPQRIFSILKQLAARALPKEAVASFIEYDSETRRTIVFVDNCDNAPIYLNAESGPYSDAAVNDAATVVTLTSIFVRYGLGDVAAPFLGEIEKLGIQEITTALSRSWTPRVDALFRRRHDDLRTRMIRALNVAIASRQIRSLKVLGAPGCGAGELGYKLASTDSTARMFVIKEFYWMVCQARNIDPNDREGCLGWTEVTGREGLTGSGGYRYQAVWHDGTVNNGTFRITDKMIEDIDASKRPDVITIPVRK